MSAISERIEGRARDIGGFAVRRVLPYRGGKMVGPWIFFDHMGPAGFAPGQGMDVRPHPHIGLSTVTYLFSGEIMHRDSVGSVQAITPGAVNWMTAGRGIVHSERTPDGFRASGGSVHGIQTWVALPDAELEREPGFTHAPAASIPNWEDGGAHHRLLVGVAFGHTAPVPFYSPLFYLHVEAASNAYTRLPDGYSERAVYVVSGAVSVDGEPVEPGTMAVIVQGASPVLRLGAGASIMLLGGEPIGRRVIYWNFVAASAERLELAKRDWRARRFPAIPGDDAERIELPET